MVAYGFKIKNKDGDSSSSGTKDESSGPQSNEDTNKNTDKPLEDIQSKLNTLTHKATIQKVRIISPYLLEWNLIPFPENYRVPNIDKYHGKGSQTSSFIISTHWLKM